MIATPLINDFSVGEVRLDTNEISGEKFSGISSVLTADYWGSSLSGSTPMLGVQVGKDEIGYLENGSSTRINVLPAELNADYFGNTLCKPQSMTEFTTDGQEAPQAEKSKRITPKQYWS